MSGTSEKVSVVSIGVSCQGAMQIRAHAPLISKLCAADISVDGEMMQSGFPFDWRIMPPASFCSMAEAMSFFPQSPDELTNPTGVNGEGIPPFWPQRGCYFWHDFKVEGGTWNVAQAFATEAAKYDYMVGKFLQLSNRRVFILSNTQNNLDMVAARTGLDFTFDRARVSAVARSIDRLFPAGGNELIVVTSKDRIGDDARDWPGFTYFIDRSTLGPDDVTGDTGQWGEMFSRYFGTR